MIRVYFGIILATMTLFTSLYISSLKSKNADLKAKVSTLILKNKTQSESIDSLLLAIDEINKEFIRSSEILNQRESSNKELELDIKRLKRDLIDKTIKDKDEKKCDDIIYIDTANELLKRLREKSRSS